MDSVAIVTMLVVCSLVWGGFVAFALRAVRAESRKRGS